MSFNNPQLLNGTMITPNQNINNFMQIPNQNLNNFMATPNQLLNDRAVNPKQPLKKLDKFIAFASKSLCLIDYKNKFGSGFLLKLFKGNQDFYVLMTCEHVITREMIQKRETINFYYDSIEYKTKQIILDPDKRFIQDFKQLYEFDKSIDINIDATIIQILPGDNIPKEYFLQVHEEYINNLDNLKNKDISIIQYPKGDLEYAYGNIIAVDKYEFSHSANTKFGSSGSPILLRNTLKVIGIHTKGVKLQNENYGYCLGPIYNYFKYFSRNKIELNIKLYNRHTDINKEIAIGNLPPLGDTKINKKTNEMTLFYEIKGNSVQIFGQKFVENNIDNCYILINGEEKRELCSILKRNEVKLEKNIFKIILIEKKGIYNMSSLFCNCTSLKYIQDIEKWNTENVTNMSSMFFNCSSLEYFPDISQWNTANVKDMRNMFGNCTLLKSMPDISNWNLSSVINVDYMFSKCILLTSLPDISKWDTSNIKNMSYMFSNCVSLKALPDISKWNVSNVTNMSYMFQNCRALTSLINLSRWKIREDIEKENMFEGCYTGIIPERFKENDCCLIY